MEEGDTTPKVLTMVMAAAAAAGMEIEDTILPEEHKPLEVGRDTLMLKQALLCTEDILEITLLGSAAEAEAGSVAAAADILPPITMEDQEVLVI